MTPRSWSPPTPLVAVSWALAALMLVLTYTADDNAGMLLLGLASVLLILLGAYGTLVRPRLTADASGIAVRGMTGTRHWPWHEVKVRLAHTRRLGRDTYSLELDDGTHLVVLTKFDLGVDPEEVADVLHAMRP